jgi:hypothetical protein
MSDADSEDGKRASKKRKASRACDRCNVQHQPCDNATPKCSVCERAGTECTYNRPIRKRGPRTGYTAQFGERLWGLMLQASPEIEDTVLQILARGTYGDTGILNADYFKNNDHQTELVNRFKESRLGHFVQTGELPPVDALRNSPASRAHAAEQPAHPYAAPNSADLGHLRDHSTHSRRSTLSAGSKASPRVNPHGAPQNPGDIYTLSEDIRRRTSESAEVHNIRRNSPQAISRAPIWPNFPAPGNESSVSPFNFNADGLARTQYDAMLQAAHAPSQSTSNLQHSAEPQEISRLRNPSTTNFQLDGQLLDTDLADMNPW